MQALDIDDMNMANMAERHMRAMFVNGCICTVIARISAARFQALENSVGLGQVGTYSEGDGSILGYDSHRGHLLKNGRASGSCGLASGGRGLGSGGRGLATGGHKLGTFGNSVPRKHTTKLQKTKSPPQSKQSGEGLATGGLNLGTSGNALLRTRGLATGGTGGAVLP